MNLVLQGAWASLRFELQRSFSAQRISVTLMLALFPPCMLGLLIYGARYSDQIAAAQGSFSQMGSTATIVDSAQFLTVFLVALVLLLSLLLWATPNVYNELEGKSWTFIACRPSGRQAVFLGKFLASVLVSFGISMVAVSLCTLIMSRNHAVMDPARMWVSMNVVYFLATLIYSALFSMIGVLFVKRAMVVGAGFLIGFDIFLASLPGALINRFSVRHHLQEIGIVCIGWFFPAPAGSETEYRYIYGQQWPVAWHVLTVLIATVVFLVIGLRVIAAREYVTGDQS